MSNGSADCAAREAASIVEQFCQANGQILLPILEMIQSASQAVETVIHEIGLRTLETILVLSAEQVAGRRAPGQSSGDIRRHGSQPGCVQLSDRKVRVRSALTGWGPDLGRDGNLLSTAGKLGVNFF